MTGRSLAANRVVPPGLESFLASFPALKRWATLGRPSGTGFSRPQRLESDSRLRSYRNTEALSSMFLLALLLLTAVPNGSAQEGAYERTYRQSKSAVERALKELQPSMGGRLPALEGFAVAGDHPLNRYQRAYYQSAVQVSATASGGAVVRVSTKVTAWYADSTPSRSGYQLLTSNGRIESDLLDQLTELLATRPGATSSGGNSGESFPVIAPPAASGKRPAAAGKGAQEPTISAPMPRLPENGGDVPVYNGAGPVEPATGGFEEFAGAFRSCSNQFAG